MLPVPRGNLEKYTYVKRYTYPRTSCSTPARSGPLGLDLVTVASCTTQVSGVEYDEALSLCSTFLAIGATRSSAHCGRCRVGVPTRLPDRLWRMRLAVTRS